MPIWVGSARPGRISTEASAIGGYYTQNDPGPFQYVGNLLRARDLVWDDPMAPPPEPLPRAPEPK